MFHGSLDFWYLFFLLKLFKSSELIDPERYFYYELFLFMNQKRQRKNFIHNFSNKICNKGTSRIVCGSSNRIRKSQGEEKKWPQIYIVSMTNLCESKSFFSFSQCDVIWSLRTRLVESNFAIDHEKWPFTLKNKVRSFQVWEKVCRSEMMLWNETGRITCSDFASVSKNGCMMHFLVCANLDYNRSHHKNISLLPWSWWWFKL